MKKKVNVLGTWYSVYVRKYDEDPEFKMNSFAGYCDEVTKEIVLCDMATVPGWDVKRARLSEKQTLRHEIVHAFLNESGLSCSGLIYEGSWAKNEEMVDWFAMQGPKIYEAWRYMGCEL